MDVASITDTSLDAYAFASNTVSTARSMAESLFLQSFRKCVTTIIQGLCEAAGGRANDRVSDIEQAKQTVAVIAAQMSKDTEKLRVLIQIIYDTAVQKPKWAFAAVSLCTHIRLVYCAPIGSCSPQRLLEEHCIHDLDNGLTGLTWPPSVLALLGELYLATKTNIMAPLLQHLATSDDLFLENNLRHLVDIIVKVGPAMDTDVGEKIKLTALLKDLEQSRSPVARVTAMGLLVLREKGWMLEHASPFAPAQDEAEEDIHRTSAMTPDYARSLFREASKECIRRIIHDLPCAAAEDTTRTVIDTILRHTPNDVNQLQDIIYAVYRQAYKKRAWASTAMLAFDCIIASVNSVVYDRDQNRYIFPGSLLAMSLSLGLYEDELADMVGEPQWNKDLLDFLKMASENQGNPQCHGFYIGYGTVFQITMSMMASVHLFRSQNFDLFVDWVVSTGPLLDELDDAKKADFRKCLSDLQELAPTTRDILTIIGMLHLYTDWKIEE